jgi:hypothetical protein
MRSRLATGTVGASIACLLAGAAVAAQSAQPTTPAQAAQSPLPAEDPARIQLEIQFKELQRREQFETMTPRARESLLANIINYCIELGRDCTSYQQKLKEVQEKLKSEGSAQAKQQQRERLNGQLKQRALQLMASVPPDWTRASQLLDQALRLSPADPETLALKAQASAGVRQLWIRRVALGSLLGLAGLGGLLAALKGLKGSGGRQLEMIEGPQPGDSFRLEKETTSLGALAAESDWVIADPARRISRRHCEISRSGRHYFLTDCSSNGTFINGRPAPKGEPILLHKGDLIALAEDVVVRFR